MGLLFTLFLLTAVRPDAWAQCPVDVANGYILDIGQTGNWPGNNATRRVRGTIRVRPGAVLTMYHAVIEFDDTRQRWADGGYTADNSKPSRILVEPGGRLIAIGCTFTTMTGCANGTVNMWDGIVVKGDPSRAQSDSTSYTIINNPNTPTDDVTLIYPAQGRVDLDSCQITNARIGIQAGSPSYSGGGQMFTDSPNGGGGAVVIVNTSTFLNCHTGISLRPFDDPETVTASTIKYCRFTANAWLADPVYQEGTVRYGTRFGMRCYSTRGVTCQFSTFELLDGTTAFPAVLPKTLRGWGINNINATSFITNCTFRALQHGVYSDNSNSAYGSRIGYCTFDGNFSGVTTSVADYTRIYNCAFIVGHADNLFDRGVWLQGTKVFTVQNNTFRAATNCTNGQCGLARGIMTLFSDGPDHYNQPTFNQIYRNYFRNISTGIYVQQECQGLLLWCNSFVGTGPDGTGSNFVPGSLNRADIEIAVPASDPVNYPHPQQNHLIRPQQGRATGRAADAANNIFSQTCGTAGRDIRLATATAAANPFTYVYNPRADGRTLPGATGTTTAPCYPVGAVNRQSTALPMPTSFNSVCPDRPFRPRSNASLLAEADTTSDPAGRALLIDEVLMRYVVDSAYVIGGLDSAVALITALNEPYYNVRLADLQALTDYNPASRAAAPAGPRKRGALATGRTARREATEPAAQPGTAARVTELLAPLGNEKAIHDTLTADAGLRGELEAMAADTHTSGYLAARAALRHYLGYTFADEEDETALLKDQQRADEAARRAAAPAVALYPNPTDGDVQLVSTPGTLAGATLRLYDHFGSPARQLDLPTDAAAETATFSVRGLRPGLYGYVLALPGGQVVRGSLMVR